ncbi:MAG TPA: F0F1 ATP synthase subunit B [Bacteroidia bacterium]|nr:F0F1 ATP synthase subunit B [Bacteroidia bacterium]
MLINWFTVTAQVVNFLILVWLLKRYLYKPVLNAIDEREKKIAEQVGSAEKKEADAIKAQEEFRKKNETFDNERSAMMNKAVLEVKTEQQRLLEEARSGAEEMRRKLDAALQEDQDRLAKEITRKTKEEVFALTGKLLKDLAGKELDEQIAAVFTERLADLSGEEKKKMAAAMKDAQQPVVVRSGTALKEEQKKKLEEAIKKSFGDVALQFVTAAEMTAGIELTAGGYKMAWSIPDYLSSAGKMIDEALINGIENKKSA